MKTRHHYNNHNRYIVGFVVLIFVVMAIWIRSFKEVTPGYDEGMFDDSISSRWLHENISDDSSRVEEAALVNKAIDGALNAAQPEKFIKKESERSPSPLTEGEIAEDREALIAEYQDNLDKFSHLSPVEQHFAEYRWRLRNQKRISLSFVESENSDFGINLRHESKLNDYE